MVPMGLILSEQGPAQLLVIERYELTFIFVTGFRTVFGPVKDRNRSERQSVVFRFLCVEVASKGEPELSFKSRSKCKKLLTRKLFFKPDKNFFDSKILNIWSKIQNDQFRLENSK